MLPVCTTCAHPAENHPYLGGDTVKPEDGGKTHCHGADNTGDCDAPPCPCADYVTPDGKNKYQAEQG